MNRTEKQESAKKIGASMQKAKACILADYRGLTVAEMTSLRRRLHNAKSVINVVKNRIAKKALKELSIEGLDDFFKGPTAIAITDTDPVMSAKAMVDFAKENEKLKIKVGFMDGKVLSLAMLKELASLPSREILLARLLRAMNAPATNFVGVLAAIPRQLVTALNAIKEKKN